MARPRCSRPFGYDRREADLPTARSSLVSAGWRTECAFDIVAGDGYGEAHARDSKGTKSVKGQTGLRNSAHFISFVRKPRKRRGAMRGSITTLLSGAAFLCAAAAASYAQAPAPAPAGAAKAAKQDWRTVKAVANFVSVTDAMLRAPKPEDWL